MQCYFRHANLREDAFSSAARPKLESDENSMTFCKSSTQNLPLPVKHFVSQELGHQVSLIRRVAKKVFAEMGTTLSYKVGTMIEIPRAALVADEVG